MAIRLGDTELELLQLGSLEFGRLYMHLRSLMDYRTGIVGVSSYLSYQSLIAPLSWRPPQGSRRPGWLPSVRELRSLIDEGVRLGLLKRYTTQEATDSRRLVLLLSLADRDMAAPKKSGDFAQLDHCGQKHERHMSVTGERQTEDCGDAEPVRVSGYSYIEERHMSAGDERQSISGSPERYLAKPSSSHPDTAAKGPSGARDEIGGSQIDPFAGIASPPTTWQDYAEALSRLGWNKGEGLRPQSRHQLMQLLATKAPLGVLIDADAVARSRGGRSALYVAKTAVTLWDEQRSLSASPPSAEGQRWVGTWFKSWSGIEAKADELGIVRDRGEADQDFRRRVYFAAGLTLDMYRRASSDPNDFGVWRVQ